MEHYELYLSNHSNQVTNNDSLEILITLTLNDGLEAQIELQLTQIQSFGW